VAKFPVRGFAADDILVHAGRVFDVRTKQVKQNETIVIHDGRILRVESGFTAAKGSERVIDLSGRRLGRTGNRHSRARTREIRDEGRRGLSR
jgi:hypothetical protein